QRDGLHAVALVDDAERAGADRHLPLGGALVDAPVEVADDDLVAGLLLHGPTSSTRDGSSCSATSTATAAPASASRALLSASAGWLLIFDTCASSSWRSGRGARSRRKVPSPSLLRCPSSDSTRSLSRSG